MQSLSRGFAHIKNMITKSATNSFPFKVCEALAPYLPMAAHTQQSIERLLRFSQLLPSKIFSKYFLIEHILDSNIFDLLFCHPNIQKTALNEGVQIDSLPLVLQQEPGWKRLCQVIETIRSDTFQQNSNQPALWLEFDVGSSRVWPPSPNIGFANKKTMGKGDLFSILHAMRSTDAHEMIDQVVTQAKISGLDIVHTGIMMARASEWVKLGFGSQELPELLEHFFRNIPYHHSVVPLIPLIKKIQPHLTDLDLQLDINKTIRGKIGIECYSAYTSTGYQWIPFLEILVREKLLSKDQTTALLSSIGDSSFTHHNENVRCVRRISNFKIVYEPNQPIQIKAYLGVAVLQECHAGM